ESLDEVGARVRHAIDLRAPKGAAAQFVKVASLGALLAAIPRTVSKAAPVQEVVEAEPDLLRLPVLQTWPMDAGPFITLPLVITKDPETGVQNAGVYRVQIFGSDVAGMHWQRHKQGRAQAAKWGRKTPVAIVLGGPPAATYAATAPLPP